MKSNVKMWMAALGMLSAMAAQAATTVDLGDVSGAEDLFFLGGPGSTTFTFNWLAEGGAGDLISSFVAPDPAPISSVTFDGGAVFVDTVPASGYQVAQLFSGVLSIGTHSFTVNATGAYGGTIFSLPVDSTPGSVVPESGVSLLALAGLGVVGLLLRRRSL